MVAPVDSFISELEKGAARNLYSGIKNPSKGSLAMSREGIEEMSSAPEVRSVPTESDRERDGNSWNPGGYSQRGSQPVRDKPAYIIRWNRFEEQVCNAFAELFCSDHFVDVTLACDGELMKAHKIVLAMSSPFFRRIFQDTPCKHPVVIIKGIAPKTLRSILHYLYLGEVILEKGDINDFMDAADYLSICGVLANLYSCDISSTTLTEVKKHGNEPEDTAQVSTPRASENEASESEFRDSQSSEPEDISVVSQSAVIKYHGVKSRWSRRYSNNSFHGSPTTSSPISAEHKRSASAGEVEMLLDTQGMTPASERREAHHVTAPIAKLPTEAASDSDMHSTDGYRYENRSVAMENAEGRQRRIIQRAYAKDYHAFDDSSDTQLEDWRSQSNLQPSCNPSTPSSSTSGRSLRSTPYALGGKDFNHPLQVAVDSQTQSMYGASSSSSVAIERTKPKSHPGFMYTQTHSMQSQRSLYRGESEPDFPTTSTALNILAYQGREERALKHRISSASSSTSPTTYRHHDYPPRSHLSLLSTPQWAFQEARSSSHNDDSSRDVSEGRLRSDGPTSFGSTREYLSQSSHTRLGNFVSELHPFSSTVDMSVPVSQQFALGYIPQMRSPSSTSSTTRPKTKAIRSSQVPQSSRYTAAEVDQMVEAVANYPGNIVPCTLCQKFVKRERLRAHIHECHLLTGEKIICPHCGIALKSKGSFRVHIWRHKRGALPTRNSMTDFGKGPPSSPSCGPASH